MAMRTNVVPKEDGEQIEFINMAAKRESGWWDDKRSCIFINGMKTSGNEHLCYAVLLSWLQMCRVVGVYNMSEGFWPDVGQCIDDKMQFHGPGQLTAEAALSDKLAQTKRQGERTTPYDAMYKIVERNKACSALFELLRDPDYKEAPIIAHSQGNLILSNALCAVAALDGVEAIKDREVIALGSPTVNWPKGLKQPQNYAFTFDPITYLGGIDFSFNVSKVGLPSGADLLGFASHSFLSYLANYPRFFINRFRWGSLGMTLSFEEDGLANALVGLGTNIPLLLQIFKRLAQDHRTDADDVALLYVEKIAQNPSHAAILSAVRADIDLRVLLICVMEQGWTTDRERSAINILKA